MATYVLGLSALYHDAAAALLCDGDLVAAAQEERFTRVKFDHRLPWHAVDYCLRTAGIAARELDYVVFYEKPLVKFERILLGHLATYPRSWRVFREAMIAWFGEKLWVKTLLQQHLGVPADRILFVEHHDSHAASAMYCSPFHEAAVLTLDGVGEWTTTALGRATAAWDGRGRNAIALEEELHFPHSLGLLYSAFTAWLGFKVNSGEYKVMGMAPYGEPRYLDRVERVARLAEALARAMGLDAGTVEEIAMAARLHDVGKIAVPDAVLGKPGRLTPEEHRLIRRHAEAGYQILQSAPLPVSPCSSTSGKRSAGAHAGGSHSR